jgi:pSer/pThr/pTyr-binding forkhead associated (FHA) protein
MPAPAQGGGNWGGAPAMADAAPQAPWGQPAAPPAPQQQGFGAAQPPAGGFDSNGYGPFGSPLAAPPQQQAAASKRPGVLLVKQGKEPGRVYEFHNDRLTIGRSRDSDIFLEDLAVSRLHATVFRDTTGQYIVRDENSANGTTVNGMRIGEQPLNENDEIALGQTVLVFQRR